jgi:hypothetical protein
MWLSENNLWIKIESSPALIFELALCQTETIHFHQFEKSWVLLVMLSLIKRQ